MAEKRLWRRETYVDDDARIVDVADHPSAAVRDDISDSHPGCRIMYSQYDYEGEQAVEVDGYVYRITARLVSLGPEQEYAVAVGL